MRIIVLGSGTSHGIPVVGCNCPVCASDDPRDKRMRSSIYIEGRGGERAVIDTGPEFRLQALRAGICGLDGIFLTHSHADHLHGLDDVRSINRNEPIPVYGNEKTIAEMIERFPYIFGPPRGETQRGGGKPRLLPRVVDSPVHVGGLTFTPVPVKHGILDILGWEVVESSFLPGAVKSFLYLTDTSAIPAASLERLRNAGNSRVIIIGGLRMRPHETHFSFEQALTAALSLGGEKVFLTHICHDHSHANIEEICRNFRELKFPGSNNTHSSTLKPKIHPAQDGLEITL